MTKGTGPHVGRRTAFVLIEIMLSLALFTAFSLVAYRLISLTLHVSSETSRVEQAHRSFDAALDRLRRDVWAARRVDVAGPSTVTVASPDGATITWRVDPAGLLARAESRPDAPVAPSQWPGAGAGINFTADAAGLAVDAGGKRGHDRASFRFVSQRILAEARDE